VHTEFHDVSKRPGAQPDTGPEFVFVPVEQVVRDAFVALEANRPFVIPGFPMKLGMFLVRITPLPIVRLLSRLSPRRS
jgi:short-subunit dehydrogenase